jgi:hypothetical protein
MKGQITRHEWQPDGMFKKCPHCKVVKQNMFHKTAVYMLPNFTYTKQEPKCITRKKQEDGTNTM